MAPDCAAQLDFGLTFGATLPLKALPRFSSEELLVAVNCILIGAGAMVELQPELTAPEKSSDDGRVWHRAKAPPRIGLSVNSVTIQIEGHDRLAYDSSDLTQLDTRSWTDGRERISRTRAHVLISEVWTMGGSDFDHNFDRAAAVTVVVEAVARLTEAIGVVWHTSGRAVPIDQFTPLFTALMEGQAPIQLWLGCSGGQERAAGATTRGLYPLLGAEIEVASTDLAPEIAVEVALDVVGEIFRTGSPPAKDIQIDFNKIHAFSVDYRVGARKPRNVGDMPKVVLTQVILPVGSKVTAGAA